MRNPKRIEGFMRKLTEVWKCVPDWRFGQLVENIARMNGVSVDRLFFIEDDKFNDMIDKFMKGMEVKPD